MKLTLNAKSSDCQEKSTKIELNTEESTYSYEDVEKENEFNLSGKKEKIKEIVCNSSNDLNDKEFLEKGVDLLYEIKDNDNYNFKIFFGFMDLLNEPVPIKEKIEIRDNSKKSTDDKSILIKKCIFGIKSHRKIEPRIDYAIKNFKVHVIKFVKEYGNLLINKCNFPYRLKKIKLFSPSYKYFTGNSNEKENKLFLDFNMERIFCYPEGKTEKNDNRLQRRNKEAINYIKEYIEEKYPKEIPENYENLLNYFKMTFQDAIILFYDSKQLKNYCSSSKTIFLDKFFIKIKGFSLLEKNGFLKLFIKTRI